MSLTLPPTPSHKREGELIAGDLDLTAVPLAGVRPRLWIPERGIPTHDRVSPPVSFTPLIL